MYYFRHYRDDVTLIKVFVSPTIDVSWVSFYLILKLSKGCRHYVILSSFIPGQILMILKGTRHRTYNSSQLGDIFLLRGEYAR